MQELADTWCVVTADEVTVRIDHSLLRLIVQEALSSARRNSAAKAPIVLTAKLAQGARFRAGSPAMAGEAQHVGARSAAKASPNGLPDIVHSPMPPDLCIRAQRPAPLYHHHQPEADT